MSTSKSAWFKETLAAETAHVLRSARESVQAIGVPKIELESRFGDPAQAILQIAEDKQVDAIVVGKPGRGRIQGLLLGSGSQKLAGLAKMAVIVDRNGVCLDLESAKRPAYAAPTKEFATQRRGTRSAGEHRIGAGMARTR